MKAMLEHIGYEADEHDIEWAYEEVSDEVCAGWLILSTWGNVESAARALLRYLQPESQNMELTDRL